MVQSYSTDLKSLKSLVATGLIVEALTVRLCLKILNSFGFKASLWPSKPC